MNLHVKLGVLSPLSIVTNTFFWFCIYCITSKWCLHVSISPPRLKTSLEVTNNKCWLHRGRRQSDDGGHAKRICSKNQPYGTHAFILFIYLFFCVPIHEPPFHLPPHNISLGHPHAFKSKLSGEIPDAAIERMGTWVPSWQDYTLARW